MAYSASQLLVISGLSQNRGLAANLTMTGIINNLQSVGILSGKLRRIAIHPSVDPGVVTALRTYIPGVSCTVPVGYTTLSSVLSTVDATENIKQRSTALLSRGAGAFLNLITVVSTVSRSSREVLGSLYALENEGFAIAGPDIKTHVDLLTGGITSKFGPLAIGSQDYLRASGLYTGGSTITTGSSDVKNSINAVATGIVNLGTLYDFHDLENFGTPYGLITNLLKQGLIKSEFFQQFAEENITTDTLSITNETILTSVLSKITGQSLQKIITSTNLQLPSTNTILLNAAELLEAGKILPVSAVNAIPQGTLKSLAKQLISLNLKYDSSTDIANAFRNITIPNNPDLSSMNVPVPADDVAQLRSSVPSGTGDFNSATINNMIGTVSGYVQVQALSTIQQTVSSISNSTEAQALSAAADDLFDKYENDTAVSADNTAFITAIINLSLVAAFEAILTAAITAAAEITDQLELEIANCSIGGIDIYASVPGQSNVFQLISGLPQFGVDTESTGIATMLLNMITDDKYGQALRAVLQQGQNEQVLKTIGAGTIGIIDVDQKALEVRSLTGAGLSQKQRENVIEDARGRGLDIENALSNAATYGYNNQYYVSRGFPSA
jgi:hypothetical protein